MKEPKPDRDDIIHVASSCEMTGMEPTPPLTNAEEDAYATLGGVPAPRAGKRRSVDGSARQQSS